ncbi:transglutaminase family protein [Hoeflea prorocentri]|uniref:Transglutaminase family protein n=1 Tax=Hoeflea prorocentri TaxID=1922333 RepID=A0A9X3UI79_9HYPH|nr:transglutaminase family protein [Hoeflea prorocentri]MCY6381127.1 transglutaminase family protein [Hoeflea prorocentri]MDA5398927.1 transglutaminase family protein [Hoeflea prorocentri]
MRLSVRHRSEYAYEPAAARVSLRLKLYPSVYDGQLVENWSVTVNGDPVEPIYITGYGDETGLWQSDGEVSSVEVLAEGVIVTEDQNGIIRDLPRKPPSAIFMRSTRLTQADDAIRALAEAARQDDELKTVHDLSSAIRETVDYRPEATNSKTTAAEAMAIGAGVCQDHAHILIAACRSLEMPARYVTGYLKAADDEDELLETHAWAEAHIRNFGWVGLDPSNGISPTDHYVRIACGLDADDATPIKGHVVGGSQITLTADVAVSENQQQ